MRKFSDLHCLDLPKEKTEDGTIIIYDKNSDQTHIINVTAAYVLEECCKKTPDSIAEDLAQKFECSVSKEEIRKDVEEIIQDFINKGILQEVCNE